MNLIFDFFLIFFLCLTDTVSPSLKVGFKWETWRRGQVLPTLNAESDGVEYDAINVLGMKVGTTEFIYTQDHAKIGVSTNSKHPYVCVGDINRMESQRKRGGGTVCIEQKYIWSALDKSIVEVEE
jgi:deoxyribonuclease-2